MKMLLAGGLFKLSEIITLYVGVNTKLLPNSNVLSPN